MAINKKLIHFKNKENFDNEVANGNILDNSIVFIQDTKEISTHGTIYKSVNWSVLEPIVEEVDENFVDLGLPSGLLWANHNLGASSPEETGTIYAWGETETKETFTWETYKFSTNGTSSNLSKYNSTDNLTILESEDDAAYLIDNSTRIPTKSEYQELISNTSYEATTLNKVSGITLTSKINGNSIFFPNGILWTSSISGSTGALFAQVTSSGLSLPYFYNRCNGYSVRAVKSSN